MWQICFGSYYGGPDKTPIQEYYKNFIELNTTKNTWEWLSGDVDLLNEDSFEGHYITQQIGLFN